MNFSEAFVVFGHERFIYHIVVTTVSFMVIEENQDFPYNCHLVEI